MAFQLWRKKKPRIFPTADSIAFRYTESIGSFDLGGIYYLDYYRQPTVNIVDESLSYDRVNMVGVHGTAVAGELTLRAEAGWCTTEDCQGDDPEVRNSELRWAGGFDCNLPVSRININIQETGTLLLNSEAIESAQDVQINTPTTENMLILCLGDSWNRNTVEPEVKFILGLEDRDYLLKPSITALFHDKLEFSLAASIFGGNEGGKFGHFDERDFLELSFSRLFSTVSWRAQSPLPNIAGGGGVSPSPALFLYLPKHPAPDNNDVPADS